MSTADAKMDLVGRLQYLANRQPPHRVETKAALQEAAAEIERLRNDLANAKEWDAEIMGMEARARSAESALRSMRATTLVECAKVARLKFAGGNLSVIGNLIADDINSLAQKETGGC